MGVIVIVQLADISKIVQYEYIVGVIMIVQLADIFKSVYSGCICDCTASWHF